MFNRRRFLQGSASALGLSLVVSRHAAAAVGAWAQQQGGSQDLQTGLVWLDHKLLTGAEPNFEEANELAAAFGHEGYTDWRLPTFDEMVAAVDHGLPQNCPLWPGDGFFWWSSTTIKGGNKAYGVNLVTGSYLLTGTKGVKAPGPGGGLIYSHLFAAFVRQGT